MRPHLDHRTGIGLALLACGVLVLWLAWQPGGETLATWVGDLATVAAALTATVLCVRAAATHRGRVRSFWWLLAAATGAWTAAEIAWAVYDLVLGDVPAVSWADAGYLAAIPLTAAALLVHPALRGSGTSRARALLDGLAVATALLFLSWTVVLGPLWERSDLSELSDAVALAYPFGDAVLIFFVVLAVHRMTGAERTSLALLLGGLLAMAVGDSAYAYLTGVAEFDSGGPLDVTWIAAYLGIGLSAWLAAPAHAPATRRPRADLAAAPLAPLVVPFVPVLAALVVLGVQAQLGHRPDRPGLAAALVLVLLVLTRQALLLRDLRAHRPIADDPRLERAWS
ncbi:MAG TPA: hypothetical protein VFS37_00770 [Conexibacter sp.]|nr:hypothetical protein [Conexibacter sp.]